MKIPLKEDTTDKSKREIVGYNYYVFFRDKEGKRKKERDLEKNENRYFFSQGKKNKEVRILLIE